MIVCDRCRRLAPVLSIQQWTVCAACYRDYQKVVGGFFGGKAMDVKLPDVVASPVEADLQVPSTVVVKE